MRIAASNAGFETLLANARGDSVAESMISATSEAELGAELSVMLAMCTLHENDHVKTMRSMHAANQRAHVRGGAGPGDEDKISIQTFVADAISAPKKIPRRFDNIFGGKDCDVHARQQTYETGVIGIERDAYRSGSRDGGESVGDADVRGGEFGFAASREYAREPFARREKIGRKIGRRGDSDAARFRRNAANGASQLFGLISKPGRAGGARNSLYGGGSGKRGALKFLEGGLWRHGERAASPARRILTEMRNSGVIIFAFGLRPDGPGEYPGHVPILLTFLILWSVLWLCEGADRGEDAMQVRVATAAGSVRASAVS
jgi:hypothetical protein